MLLLLPDWYHGMASAWQATFGDGYDMWLSTLLMWFSTELTFWSINLFFFSIEALGLFKEHRIHAENSNVEQFKSTLLHKPLTYLVDVPIYLATAWTCNGSPFDPLPSGTTIATQVIISALTFDFMFYCWHRFLHTRYMWEYHKKHHEVKICYASANDHESLLEVSGNILWKMIPPMVMKSHVYTVCVFRSVVKFFALLHHSGYELPIFKPLQFIPFMSSPADHDFHHYQGHSNYGGVFMLWDFIAGTHVTWKDKAERKIKRQTSWIAKLTVHDTVAVTKEQLEELPYQVLSKMATEVVKQETEGKPAPFRRQASLMKMVEKAAFQGDKPVYSVHAGG